MSKDAIGAGITTLLRDLRDASYGRHREPHDYFGRVLAKWESKDPAPCARCAEMEADSRRLAMMHDQACARCAELEAEVARLRAQVNAVTAEMQSLEDANYGSDTSPREYEWIRHISRRVRKAMKNAALNGGPNG